MTKQSPNKIALYIHWPFCKKKCPYCDFNSHVRGNVNHTRYRNALLTELRAMHALMPDAALSSIFFGGGTPSLMLPETTHALIEEAKQLWPSRSKSLLVERSRRESVLNDLIAECSSTEQEVNAKTLSPSAIEITLEANPTSVESDTFSAFKQAGINRVSLGIQSLRPDALAFLGREHSAEEALKAIERAASTFERYSFDLIYALPHQTVDAWEAELKEALQFARGHLSLYQLTIEPNTAFHTAYFGKKAFELPDESLAAALYLRTQEVMEQAGLPAYEISNHATLGQESQHNLSYWRSDYYVGIGPGAHGRISAEGCAEQLAHGRISAEGCAEQLAHGRISVQSLEYSATARREARGVRGGETPPENTYSTLTHKTPERWLECVERDGHALAEMIPISAAERMEEKLLMGLRLAEGFPLSRFSDEERAQLSARVKPNTLRTLEKEGLLTTRTKGNDTIWHTTPRGRLVLNAIIESLLT